MGSVIKAGGDQRLSIVRSVPRVDHSGMAQPPVAEDPLRKRIAELEAALGAMAGRVESLSAEATKAHERGLVEGREQGRREAKADDEARLAKLSDAISGVLDSVAEQFRATESLALLLAQDCFEKVVGDPAWRSEIVSATLGAQIARLEEGTVLSVRVSPTDFPDPVQLEEVRHKYGLPSGAVSADPSLATGDCRMVLRLGQLELGLDRQLAAISDLVAEVVQAESASR